MRDIDIIAKSYVVLAQKIDLFMPGYVDAYYGPKELKLEIGAKKEDFSLTEIRKEAANLVSELGKIKSTQENEQRLFFLKAQLQSMYSYIGLLEGEKLGFEEEAMAIYGANAKPHDNQYFLSIHLELEEKLKQIETRFGLSFEGSLGERVNNFYNLFTIPKEEVALALTFGFEKSRERTKQYIALPENENFTVEPVHDVKWKAYNWYLGNATGKIQINADRDIPLLEALVLPNHEGYPGHHTYNSLFDMLYAKEKGWIEFSIYPLFSPMSVMMEGMAKYAEKFAFTDPEKVDMLVELSEMTHISKRLKEQGISDKEAPELMKAYLEISNIHGKLEYGKIESARMFYNGSSEEDVVNWVRTYELLGKPDAERRVGFIKYYGTYITTYLSGLEEVTAYIDGMLAHDLGIVTRQGIVNNHTWNLYADILNRPPTIETLKIS